MKNKKLSFVRLASAVLCICIFLCFVGCGSKSNIAPENDTYVKTGGYSAETGRPLYDGGDATLKIECDYYENSDGEKFMKLTKVSYLISGSTGFKEMALRYSDGEQIHYDKGEKIFGNYGDDSPMVYSKNGLIKAELTVYMQNGEEEIIDCAVSEDDSEYIEADSTADEV